MFILGIILIIAGIGCAGYGFMQNNTYLVTDEATRETAVIDPGFRNASLYRALDEGDYKVRRIFKTDVCSVHRNISDLFFFKSVQSSIYSFMYYSIFFHLFS